MSDPLNPAVEEILTAAERVRWSRQRHATAGSPWIEPPRRDAILFAITEAGEALSAVMSSGYARNRSDEERDGVVSELADTAIMILTAAMQEEVDGGNYMYSHWPMGIDGDERDQLVALIRELVFIPEEPNGNSGLGYALHRVAEMLRQYGTTVSEAVEERLKTIEQKWIKENDHE